MPGERVTRGFGLLETFLARMRAKMADRLIPLSYRKGRILDIGCGTYPFALLNIDFSEKYGLDKIIKTNCYNKPQCQGITLINYDIEKEDSIPFKSSFFDAVIMLAVIEHLESERLIKILKEIYRVLKIGGIYVLTTPAPWTDNLLKFMSKLRLVSPEEIEEHKLLYSHQKLSFLLQKAGFAQEKIKLGNFEFFMNIWVRAIK